MTPADNADQTVRLHAVQRTVGGTRVLSLRGQIDYDAKETLREALAIEDDAEQPKIVADLSEVTFLDSSGIKVFVAAHLRTSEAGGWIRIAAAQDPVLRVLRLVGVDALIPCRPTLEQALAD
ncbi:STAS domain-containing protein [Streptomyces longwoodensis]|uniref:STAS domain-containing protein n=1 Tax=Streptomyces longwoodensis TaxID=68231 RepID=UPI0033B5BB71